MIQAQNTAGAHRSQPTCEQLLRLRSFAQEYGRTWKATLNQMWQNGTDARQPEAHLLRQLRNQLGPRWLVSFSLAKAKTVVELQAQALNAHHAKHAAGFYWPAGTGARYFEARVGLEARRQVLQISPDFGEHWESVSQDALSFASYWGNAIELPGAPARSETAAA